MTQKKCAVLMMAGVLSWASIAPGVPYWSPVGLPRDGMTKKNDRELDQAMAELLNVQFFRDTEDSEQYYILPVFRAVSPGIAATSIVNLPQLERLSEMNEISKAISDKVAKAADQAEPRIEAIEKAIHTQKLAAEPDQAYIARLEKMLDDERTKMANPISIAPFIERMSSLLALSQITPEHGERLSDNSVRMRYLSQAAAASAGELNANINARLQPEERNALVAYQRKRVENGLPALKFSTLPISGIKFSPLSEIAAQDGRKLSPKRFFRDMAAAGNFQGATLSVDLDGDAAKVLSIAPQPMILPVAAKAEVLMKFPAFKVRLDCSFREWVKARMHGEVVDGAIFNDQTAMDMMVESSSETPRPCKLTFSNGQGDEQLKAAWNASMSELMKRVLDKFAERVHVSSEEAARLRKKFEEEVRDHTRSGRSGNNSETVMWNVRSGNINGYQFRGPMKGRYLAWYVNKTNLEQLSKVEFQVELEDDSNTKRSIDLPTRLCVAYHPVQKTYVACVEKELEKSTTMTDAGQKAANSKECRGTKSLKECKEKRESDAERFKPTGNVAQ